MKQNDKVRAENMITGIAFTGCIEWIRGNEVSINDGSQARIVSAETWIVEHA